MLEAVTADPGQQQQLSTALLQAQSDLGEGVAIIDLQTQRFIYVNDTLCRLYGYSAAELLALSSFLTLVVPEEQGAFHTRLAQRQQGQPTENHYELAVRRKDGMRITIEVAVTQISGPNGPQLVTLIRDITARQQTEEALRQTHAALEQQVQERTAALATTNERLTATLAEQQRITATLQESEARYRLLAEHTTDVITRHVLDGTFLYVSPAIRTLLGYEPEELLGRSVLELFHPEDAPRITQLVSEAIVQGKAATYTYRVRHKDGHYVCGETNSQPVRDSVTGEVQAVVEVTRDITRVNKWRRRCATAKSGFGSRWHTRLLRSFIKTSTYATPGSTIRSRVFVSRTCWANAMTNCFRPRKPRHWWRLSNRYWPAVSGYTRRSHMCFRGPRTPST